MYTLEANLKHNPRTAIVRRIFVRRMIAEWKLSDSVAKDREARPITKIKVAKFARDVAKRRLEAQRTWTRLTSKLSIFLATFVKIFSRQIRNRRIYHLIRTSDAYHVRFHRKMWISERICATLTILP